MLTLALNLASKFLSKTTPLKFVHGKNLEELKCKIVEISEQQNYGLPTSPVDNGSYRGDTIYKMPLILNLRVYVKSEDIDNFIYGIEAGQFSGEMFQIYSLYDKVYKNMKVASYSRDTNSGMLGATHYNIQMQEVILVQSLVENYKNSKKPGYASKKDMGNKNPLEKPKSALFSSVKSLKSSLGGF